MAVPLAGAGWTASIDDVRSLVLAIHMRINVDHPRDDYFLNLLGTGLLAGRRLKRLAHLKGRVVILGSYKIRQPHVEKREDIEKNGEGVLKALAAAAGEIEQRGVRNCVDVLVPEVRGGPWCWRGCGATCPEDQDALAQEHRAWVHLGATPRDVNQDRADTLTYSLKRSAHLEAKHGGADPASWRWGEGTPCADVFAADEAKREYEGLKAKVAALQQLSDAASGSGATRERSRSPRHSRDMPTRSDA